MDTNHLPPDQQRTNDNRKRSKSPRTALNKNAQTTPTIASLDSELAPISEDRFQLLEEIAAGGMGSIIRTRDRLLNRDMAVKVLIDGIDQDAEIVQRFYEEAQINSQLQHPGIVPVYEVGRLKDSRPFFAMKLVKGQTLRKLLDQRSSPEINRSRVLGIFEQVCQTVAYAHSRNVIHRDLKPANIMVGAFGEVQVMDWGIAKILRDEPHKSPPEAAGSPGQNVTKIRTLYGREGENQSDTQCGIVVGSLAYMSPEQALGEKEAVDERTDVFALGAILCEILTGQAPYVGKSTKALFRLAARGQMDEALQRLEHCGADAELIDLAKNCLEYEPELRPDNASKVADRMSDYFHSVETRLQQAELDRTKLDEEKKRRHVSLALAATLIGSVLLAACCWIWMQSQQAEIDRSRLAAALAETVRQQQKAEFEKAAKQDALLAKRDALLAEQKQKTLRDDAEAATRQREITLSDAYTYRGLNAAEKNDAGAAIMWFAAAAEIASFDEERVTNSLIRANNWDRYSASPIGAIEIPGRPKTIRFQPDGALTLVRYTPINYINREPKPPSPTFKNQSNSELKWLEEIELPGVPRTKHAALFTIFDWRRNSIVEWLPRVDIRGVPCWSPDGIHIAIARPSPSTEAEHETTETAAHPKASQWKTNDSTQHVSEAWQVEIRDALDGRIVAQFNTDGEVTALTYSGDGKCLAIATNSSTSPQSHLVRLWDVERSKMRGVRWQQSAEIHSMRFHFDGTRLVVAGLDSIARVYETLTKTAAKDPDEALMVIPHVDLAASQLNDCRHAPLWLDNGDGKHLIAAICGISEMAIWDVDSNELLDRDQISIPMIGRSSASDSGWRVTCGASGFQLSQGEKIAAVHQNAGHANFISSARFSSDGSKLLTGSLGTNAQLWSVPDLQPIGPVLNHDGGVGTVDISDNDAWLATVTMGGLVRIWTSPNIERLQMVDQYKKGRRPEFSRDDRYVLTRKWDTFMPDSLTQGATTILDTKTGQPVGRPINLKTLSVNEKAGKLCDICFVTDCRSVVVAHSDSRGGFLSWVEFASEDVSAEKTTPHQVKCQANLSAEPVWVASHPHLPIAAAICRDNKLNVVDLKSGETLYTRQYDARTGWHALIAFTPDGKQLIFCNETYFQALDSISGEECFEPVEYPNANFENCRIAVSPDSQTLAVSSSKSARFWNLSTGVEMGVPLVHVQTSHYLGAIADMQFSPNSQRLLTACFDKSTRLWDWKTGRQVCPPMKHPGAVHCSAFSPDGKYAITGSSGSDGGPWIWDLATGMPVAPSLRPDNGRVGDVLSIAVSNSGQVFGSRFVIPKERATFKFDLDEILTTGLRSTPEYRAIGELTAGKQVTLGQEDGLSKDKWLEKWDQLMRREHSVAGQQDETIR